MSADRGPVRAAACDLVARQVWFTERIAVLGATGWFGSTMLALLADHPAAVLAVASRPRPHRVGDRTWSVIEYDVEEIAAFAPTVVLDFAYLTRQHEEVLGEGRYRAHLADLTRRLVRVCELPSVRAVLTVSSGAAVAAPEGARLPVGPYGEGKRDVEQVAAGLVNAARSVVVARAYSVSGALVARPGAYAFSDFVRQARTGVIDVTARSEVRRRYCGVDDYLAVCVGELMDGRSGIVESGGTLVEVRALARQVSDAFPGRRPHVRSVPPQGVASTYASDDTSWRAACARQDFVPATLSEQITSVLTHLP